MSWRLQWNVNQHPVLWMTHSISIRCSPLSMCYKKNFSGKRRNLVRLFKESYSLTFVFFFMLCQQTFAVDISVKRGDLLTIFSDFLWSQALEFRTPFFLIWSLPRLWYGSLSGSISLNHLSIFYNISCYNSFVLLTFVSRSSCRITYIYIKVWNNRQNTKRESSLRLDILQ
jgi:hypothetical protein